MSASLVPAIANRLLPGSLATSSI